MKDLTYEQEKLILDHLDAAKATARRLTFRGRYFVDYEDLESAAYLGLVKAAREFDALRGFKFITLASKRMFGSCMDCIRNAMVQDGWNRSYGKMTWIAKKEQLLDFDRANDTSLHLELERQDLINKILATESNKRRKNIVERILKEGLQEDIAKDYKVSYSAISQQRTKFIISARNNCKGFDACH